MKNITFKKILIIIFTISFLFCASIVYFLTVSTQEKNYIIKNIKEDKKEILKEDDDVVSISIEYPENNKMVKEMVLKDFEEWKREAGITATASRESLYLDYEGYDKTVPVKDRMHYGYDATYSIASSSETLTYRYSIYTFTGGAHGSAYIALYTFDKNGKRLKAEDILPEKYLERVSKVSLEKAIQEKIERNNFDISSQDFKVKYPEDYKWIQDGTKPVRENYTNIWFEKNKDGQDELVVYFDDYQLWSHAEGGGFIVNISRDELK